MTTDRAVSRRDFLTGTAGAAAAAAATGTAAAQEEGGGGGSVEVELVDYAYEPGTDEPLVIPPGTTVTFTWVTDTHNIHVDQKPADSDWAGHEPIENAGFTHEHTFEVTGDYHFWCVPHESLGMIGDITVEEGAPLPGQGGGEGAGPTIPDTAKSLGVVTFVAMVLTLGLAYFFIKYGDAGTPDVE